MAKNVSVKDEVKQGLAEFIEEGGMNPAIKSYTKKAVKESAEEIFEVLGLPIGSKEDLRETQSYFTFLKANKERCDAARHVLWFRILPACAIGVLAYVGAGVVSYVQTLPY